MPNKYWADNYTSHLDIPQWFRKNWFVTNKMKLSYFVRFCFKFIKIVFLLVLV